MGRVSSSALVEVINQAQAEREAARVELANAPVGAALNDSRPECLRLYRQLRSVCSLRT